jgi:copper(I)-binding protein
MSGDMSTDSTPGDMSGMSDDTMTGDMSGEMTMQQVQSIMLPAGEMVMLMPGGYHVMLLDIAAPLEVGQTFEITLTFANAGSKVVTVEVRDEAP